jgi:hypothetical protein
MTEQNLPIEDYLKELYPDKSAAELEQYLVWITEGEDERLPATAAIARYSELHEIYNAAEKEMKELRETIIYQKTRLGLNFNLINIRAGSRRSYDEEALYSWCETQFSPEIMEKLTVKILNAAEFKRLESLGQISYDQLPEDLYKTVPNWTLTTIKRKK